ncbi:MAG: chemotaxis protein CheA, partial [Chthoniobacterales bacterium]|nr:chemotaxis protein CheA [Chthoniobacterales bacterium]
MNPQDYQKIERWIEQISSEVILSEPDTDRSQFPLRDLINSVLDKAGKYPGYVALRECAKDALTLIEDLLFGNKPYTQESLDCLGELAGKMQSYLENPDQVYERPSILGKLIGGVMEEREGETREVVMEEVAGGEEKLQEEVGEKVDGSRVSGGEEKGFENTFVLGNTDVDLLKDFLVEANEHLDNIEQGVLQLEENPSDADTIASIFRAFHTIKGGSGFLNILPVNHLAHQLENLLDLIRDNKLEVTREVIEVILEGGDTFRTCFQEIQEQITGKRPAEPIVVEGRELLEKISELIRGQGTEEAEVIRAQEGSLVEKKEGQISASSEVEAEGKGEGKKVGTKTSGVVAGMIKVDTVKFDSLMDLVGELVIAQSLVAQDPAIRSIESRNLLRNLSQLGRITNELQKTAMSLRMVPIKNLFQKMNRVVRDTAAARGKIVNLVLQGEDTEMDRTIVEELGDPLLHMVRNSVDHGIEMPDVREAAGKPRAGMLRLAASHVGGNILVEIEDDGAGIRTDKVLAKAIERGLVSPGTHLTEKEIFELIFMPGFSTAEQVTDLSGRGVGMDVVKKNISKLRG